MTPQQETEYANQLHQLPKCDLVQEYEASVMGLVLCETTPSNAIERLRLARREITRRLQS